MTFLLHDNPHTRKGSHCKTCRRALGYANKSGVCDGCKMAAKARNVRKCKCGRMIRGYLGKIKNECAKCREKTRKYSSLSGAAREYSLGKLAKEALKDCRVARVDPFRIIQAAIKEAR